MGEIINMLDWHSRQKEFFEGVIEEISVDDYQRRFWAIEAYRKFEARWEPILKWTETVALAERRRKRARKFLKGRRKRE